MEFVRLWIDADLTRGFDRDFRRFAEPVQAVEFAAFAANRSIQKGIPNIDEAKLKINFPCKADWRYGNNSAPADKIGPPRSRPSEETNEELDPPEELLLATKNAILDSERNVHCIKALSFTLKDGCPHEKEQKSQVRFVSWAQREVLRFCNFDCECKNKRRVVAISHVWGPTRPSEIQGIPWTIPLEEGKEILDAFHGAKAEDLHWLDILCIDQSCQEELYVATKHMSKVFGEADIVNVWLRRRALPWPFFGVIDPAKSSNLLEELKPPVLGKYAYRQVKEAFDDLDTSYAQALIWFAYELLNSQWFMRVWTTQELILAQRVSFFHHPIDLALLQRWMQYLHDACKEPWIRAQAEKRMPQINHSIELKRQLDNGRSNSVPPLTSLYEAIAYRQCFFARDKVITMAPIIRRELALPTFELSDRSTELAETLWRHVVFSFASGPAGDTSILSVVTPGLSNRARGLWFPPISPYSYQRCPEFPDKKQKVQEAQYTIIPPQDLNDPGELRRVRMIPCKAIWFMDKGCERRESVYYTLTAPIEALVKQMEKDLETEMLPAPSVPGKETARKHLVAQSAADVEGMGNVVTFGNPNTEASAVSLAWIGVDAKEGGDGIEKATVRMAWPENWEEGVKEKRGFYRVWLYGSIDAEGDREFVESPQGQDPKYPPLGHPGIVGVAWVDLENAPDLSGYPVVDVVLP
ncbi:hypothetical protein HDU96_010909 [Phlyctochytrium bullatum]|nr:hypothetical protein HDU96_010909 [Phlyctochytrium bullatum]